VLAISGSLRSASSNSALVQAAVQLAPPGMEVAVYGELDRLPPFNPDLDTDQPPAPVAGFRAALQASDAVLLSSPEYAHGVPGVLKNALDWLVGSGELVGKPVALLNASSRATHAWSSLVETLSVMSWRLIREASITVPVNGTALDAKGIAGDPQLAALVKSALQHLARHAKDPAHQPAQPTEDRDATVVVSESVTPEDLLFLEAHMNEFNFATTGIRDARGLVILLRDTNRRIYAGLSGHTWGGVAEVRLLWVDEARRHTGIGSRLLRAAENEARARGCGKIVLSTHSFQAPYFYFTHDYVVAGQFSDYPREHSSVFLEKVLS
jgi:NAD(P)H-dependent FMN reductase/GNAT superfamily N-acetyltransferase